MSQPVSDAKKMIARRIAKEFEQVEDITFVNVGVGIPSLVAEYITNPHVVIQAENGMLGVGPFAEGDDVDFNLINASRQQVTLTEGCSFMDSAASFAMIRGGHIDATVIGAFEVDEGGSVANWIIPGGRKLGVGGGMDLVSGAKRVIIAMQHTGKDGSIRIKRECSLPITAHGEVDLLVTDYAVFEFVDGTMYLREIAPGKTLEDIKSTTEAKFEIGF
ncbi:MAG: 3-oxoacid CoA-transferase subunit B [Anaerovoracaceae bacterium]